MKIPLLALLYLLLASPSSATAADINPDAQQLWYDYCQRRLAAQVEIEQFDTKSGTYSPRRALTNEEKQAELEQNGGRKAYGDGVAQAIEQIKLKKPLIVPIYGERGFSFMQVSDELGVPLEQHGCVITGKDYRLNPGFIDAMQWYAQRGVYPVNSVKARMAAVLPSKLSWHQLAATKAVKAETSVQLVKSRSGFPALALRQSGKSEKLITWPHFAQFMPSQAHAADDFKTSGCQWAYDKASDTLFLRSDTPQPSKTMQAVLQIAPDKDLVIGQFPRSFFP